MEILFALVLTSCVLGDNNEFACEQFQIKPPFKTESLCNISLAKETPFLEEFDRLDCVPVKYNMETEI